MIATDELITDHEHQLVRDGLPIYRRTFVHLSKTPLNTITQTDLKPTFVNANYITNPFTQHPEDFIAAANPTKAGIPGYLNMLILKNVLLVVMLCQPSEVSDDASAKCNRYFPDKAGQDHLMKFGKFTVETTKI